MAMIGFGLVALGVVGFVGAMMSLFGEHGDKHADTIMTVGGGALVLVVAGSVVAGFGLSGARGAAVGLMGGCGSVALALSLGALLCLAALGFALLSCLSLLGAHH
jgi:hypothetical protein